MAKDEDRAFLGDEPSESTIQLVTIGNGEKVVRRPRRVDREHANVGESASLTAGVGDADIRKDPMDPGVESVRIAEVRQVPPGDHQRVLQGILGPIDIPKDPVRDRIEAITARANKIDECRLITALCRLDEVAIHRPLPAWTSIGDAVHLYWWILTQRRWKIELFPFEAV